jgi:Virulence-associated protein E
VTLTPMPPDEREDLAGVRTVSSASVTPIDDRAAKRKVKPDATGGLILSPKNIIKACEHNAKLLIDEAPQYQPLHFDEFLSRMRFGARDWSDADDVAAVCWLQSAHDVAAFTIGQTRNGARAVAYSRRRDSLREFVEGLPEWDETPRIDLAFVDAWGAPDTPLMRAASANLMIAAIARALHPGAKVDSLWVFEGPQGIRKSLSVHALGGEFHSEITAQIGTADFMRELRGIWFAELSELDSLRGKEPSIIKRVLSAPTDRFVQKYALHAESYPRRAVAIATTNEAAYWQDSTGARRLVPITCTDIRIDVIVENRLQWFAEARSKHAAGATWWEFPTGIADVQDERQQVDPWEDTLRGYMTHGRVGGIDSQGRIMWPEGWIASAAIMRDWLRLEPHQQGRASGVRLGHVMRRLGYKPKSSTTGDERGWTPSDTQGAKERDV